MEREKIHQIRIGIRENRLDRNLLAGISKTREEELVRQEMAPSRLLEPILVRELFIGGLKVINKELLDRVMNVYGVIENIELGRNFAFVKYRRVMDASEACSNYKKIKESLQSGNSTTFKLFFSDHLKRYNVVGDNPAVEVK
jgi:hypothetical protein